MATFSINAGRVCFGEIFTQLFAEHAMYFCVLNSDEDSGPGADRRVQHHFDLIFTSAIEELFSRTSRENGSFFRYNDKSRCRKKALEKKEEFWSVELSISQKWKNMGLSRLKAPKLRLVRYW